MQTEHARLSRLRPGQGDIANHVIDEYLAGRLSRRELLRRGALAVVVDAAYVDARLGQLAGDEDLSRYVL